MRTRAIRNDKHPYEQNSTAASTAADIQVRDLQTATVKFRDETFCGGFSLLDKTIADAEAVSKAQDTFIFFGCDMTAEI